MDSLSNSEKMAIRSTATFVEIIGGQPLDRIKVNYQLPKADRIPFRTLLQGGIGSFYAASTTSVIQRCFFYIPAVYFGADLWKHHFKIENSPMLDGIAASFFTSAIVSPGVSCFENLKLQQQINMKENKTLKKTFVNVYNKYGVRGLFPSLTSTFSREAAFALGMCYMSPAIHHYLKEQHDIDTVIGAGCISGITTQLITQPFDTIKTWQEKTYMTFSRSVQAMVKENGVMFLFNGTIPRVCRGMWTFSCLFYCTNEFSVLYKNRFPSPSLPSVHIDVASTLGRKSPS
jgi:fluoride ion exporter CrcB/FEX